MKVEFVLVFTAGITRRGLFKKLSEKVAMKVGELLDRGYKIISISQNPGNSVIYYTKA